MNHSASDFIIRLKNASLANRREVVLPFSNMNKQIGKVLVKEGILEEIKENGEKGKKSLKAILKYSRRKPILGGVHIISKPSLRVYMPVTKISGIERKGKHKVIISTSLGVLIGEEAKKKGVGGEILFEIW
ncbi:MAG: 30S ribosomal protein S8 [Candidatus Levybacteria bacterium]|nr:30S ribosomal protein S8 [Candidatus Levybacteria bacterium]MBI2420838.1 30S ribosomal protein S8 [Candidatus Levybacteria bacterium]